MAPKSSRKTTSTHAPYQPPPKKAEKVLHKPHVLRMLATQGSYYVVDTKKKIICRYHLDLETEASPRIGALSAWEELADG
jgi:hypothetical protein